MTQIIGHNLAGQDFQAIDTTMNTQRQKRRPHFVQPLVRALLTGQGASAKAARRGLWAGQFVPPWDWRRGKRLVSETAVNDNPPGCRIKGNIGSKGDRIYHIPGGCWYDSTVITISKGEGWFCSEEEARGAGWRRAGVKAFSVSCSKGTPSTAEPAKMCCKVCGKGQACGNSCISRRYTCRKPTGCACDR